MKMLLIEVAIIAGVLIYIVGHALKERKPSCVSETLSLFAPWPPGWLKKAASDLYGIYNYNPVWNLFIAHVPLVVVVVWPALIHSAIVFGVLFSAARKPFHPSAGRGDRIDRRHADRAHIGPVSIFGSGINPACSACLSSALSVGPISPFSRLDSMSPLIRRATLN